MFEDREYIHKSLGSSFGIFLTFKTKSNQIQLWNMEENPAENLSHDTWVRQRNVGTNLREPFMDLYK